MRAALTACILVATVTGVAHAEHHRDRNRDRSDGERDRVASDDAGGSDSGADPTKQVVVVNAAVKLGDLGQIMRVRRVLDERGLLLKLPKSLEATLDGRNVLVSDLDAIKDAYTNGDFATATKLVDRDRDRILRYAAERDPIPALTELAQWRGVIAAAADDEKLAVEQFRVAFRMNPGWSIDKRLASPRVRSLVKKAHAEPDERGTLCVDAEPDDATISIDGGEKRPASDHVELPIGLHLVIVSARGRKAYAELVKIEADRRYKLPIALDHEGDIDRAAKLVDETVAAPPGKPRLKRTRALARLTRGTRLLVVEDGSDDKITMRLYDVESKKVSRPLVLTDDASSAVIARKVTAALDPDNLVDVDSIAITSGTRSEDTPWYGHWYVWAGAAAVVAIGGGVIGYEAMHRAPTEIKF